MAQLPAQHREVLELRMSGLSAEAAAEVVGSTPEMVRIAQHAALNGLRAQLARTRSCPRLMTSHRG